MAGKSDAVTTGLMKDQVINRYSIIFQRALGISEDKIKPRGSALGLPVDKFRWVFRNALQLSDPEMRLVVQEIDTNANGYISFDEFVQYLSDADIATTLASHVVELKPKTVSFEETTELTRNSKVYRRTCRVSTVHLNRRLTKKCSVDEACPAVSPKVDSAPDLHDATLHPMLVPLTMDAETKIAYERFAEKEMDGEIHVETRLWLVVEYIGYPCTPEEIAYFALERHGFRFSTMSRDEVVAFVRAYHLHQTELWENAFLRLQHDGEITREQTVELFQSGQATQDIEVSVVEEIIEENFGQRPLKLSDLESIVHQLRCQRGFSRDQMSELQQTFSRFQKKGNVVEVSDMRELFTWLGFTFIELDYHGATQLSHVDFLNVMAQHRRKFRQQAKDVFNQWATPLGMSLQFLPHALECMDYCLRADVIVDTLSDIGITATIQDVLAPDSSEADDCLRLTSDQWLALLIMLYKKDAFTWDELNMIRDTFDEYVRINGPPTADFATVNSIFRMLGFYDMQKCTRAIINAEARRTHPRTLEPYQILVFLRFQFSFFQRRLMNCFSWHSSESLPRKLRAEMLVPLLRMSGFTSNHDKIIKLALNFLLPDSSAGIPYLILLQIASHSQQSMRGWLVKNRGFREEEAEKMKALFDQIKATDEKLTIAECRILFMNLFPSEGAMYDDLIEQAKFDASATFSFDQVLDLLRAYEDLKGEMELEDEERAIKETGFSESEVEEFRACFIAVDVQTKHTLDFDTFMKYVSMVFHIPARDASNVDIRCHMEKFVSGRGTSDVSFPEFLYFMKSLIDKGLINFRARRKIFS